MFDQKKLAGIEGGTRDAYICRKHDCSGYLMVTTDMCVGKSKVWDNYGINLLTSDDMLNWKSVTFDFRKGAAIFSDKDSPDPYKDYSKINRVWAPQIFWDPAYVWPDGRKGGYLIYYSMLNRAEEGYDRMYYSYADESFTTLTKPRLLFDWGYATIDADINYLASDGLYHMMIKKEGGQRGLFTATAPKLTGPWSEPVEDDYVDFEGNKKCEGVSALPARGRLYVGDRLHRVLLEAQALPPLPRRQVPAQLPLPAGHKGRGGPAARLVHAPDQGRIRPPGGLGKGEIGIWNLELGVGN